MNEATDTPAEKPNALLPPKVASQDALIAQLIQLNERSRWYSSRLWQEPSVYIGASGVVAASLFSQDNQVQSWVVVLITGLLALLGCLWLQGLNAIHEAKEITVKESKRVEERLELGEVSASRGITKWVLYIMIVVIAANVGGMLIAFSMAIQNA